MPLVGGADLNGTASGDQPNLGFNRPYRASPTGLYIGPRPGAIRGMDAAPVTATSVRSATVRRSYGYIAGCSPILRRYPLCYSPFGTRQASKVLEKHWTRGPLRLLPALCTIWAVHFKRTCLVFYLSLFNQLQFIWRGVMGHVSCMGRLGSQCAKDLSVQHEGQS
eukprot:6171831-Pleurochrysis_carterae.AAC.2